MTGMGGLRGRKSRQRFTSILLTIILAIGAIIVLLPILWMLSTSLKDQGQVFIMPPKWIPNPIRWGNYPEALDFMNWKVVYRNTIMITTLNILGTLISSTLVAFAFARLRAPKKDLLFLIMLSTIMLPYQVVLIPQFILFKTMGWVDTFYPLIVPFFFATTPFLIFLLRQFFMTIPIEMDEAAIIDGCNYFQVYYKIILPLSKPALGIVAIQSFMNNWNDLMRPLIFLNSAGKYTVSLALANFSAEYGMTPWNLLMAASLIALLPCILLFFFAQRYFIQGIVITGLKG
jgi:ABC-type glycerol-3-phosphate transport system permease component